MKVLRVISGMNPRLGGPGQGIRNSIPELKKLGVETDVVCLDDPSDDFVKKEPFRVFALGPATGPWSYSGRLIPWLEQHVKNYDVVIIHGLWLFTSYAVTKVMKKISEDAPRLYIMPHGMLDPYFQNAKTRRLKALRNWIYWKVIENRVVAQADALLFTCQAELELARLPFRPYKPKNEINVGYGVPAPPPKPDAKDFISDKFENLDSKPFFLFLSRVHQKKGVDLLVRAYALLKKEGMDIPNLVIAGPGMDTDYGQDLATMVSENPELASSIIFVGMLLGNEKWSAFYECEAFILPSHQENFGIAVVEAMACGKPVLISDQVNIWNEILAGGAGLVEPDTLTGVANLLRKWITLPDQEKLLMAESSKKTYEEKFAIGPAARTLAQAVFF